MHTRPVFHLAAALHEAGYASLRLNFRGVGLSAGRYTGGPGEREDVRSALAHLEERLPGGDRLVAGHSFGAWVGLRVGTENARVGRLIGVGMPLDVYEFGFLDGVSKDMLFVQGDRDRFGSAASVRALAERVGGCAVILPGGEHLLEGHLAQLRDAVREHLARPETGVPPRA
jgi:alpha/beta superfamily hydrolase